MLIDHAVERLDPLALIGLLHIYKTADRSEVIAEGQPAGRLDAREDAGREGGAVLLGCVAHGPSFGWISLRRWLTHAPGPRQARGRFAKGAEHVR